MFKSESVACRGWSISSNSTYFFNVNHLVFENIVEMLIDNLITVLPKKLKALMMLALLNIRSKHAVGEKIPEFEEPELTFLVRWTFDCSGFCFLRQQYSVFKIFLPEAFQTLKTNFDVFNLLPKL